MGRVAARGDYLHSTTLLPFKHSSSRHSLAAMRSWTEGKVVAAGPVEVTGNHTSADGPNPPASTANGLKDGWGSQQAPP